MNIRYKVEFFTDWHCGSGLGAGADVDALVVKDSDCLPFIPGKTVKGLLREAVKDIIHYRTSADPEEEARLNAYRDMAFGVFDDSEGKDDGRPKMTRGSAYFTNAQLPESERRYIIKEVLWPYLYRTVSSTKIDEKGIAEDHSLRRTETTVPCILEGEIIDLPDEEVFLGIIKDAFRYVKRLGQNRNRGFGRCSFTILDNSTQKEA